MLMLKEKNREEYTNLKMRVYGCEMQCVLCIQAQKSWHNGNKFLLAFRKTCIEYILEMEGKYAPAFAGANISFGFQYWHLHSHFHYHFICEYENIFPKLIKIYQYV